jgi:hypothetical protein
MVMDMVPRDVSRNVLEGRSHTTSLHRTAKFLLNLHRYKATETTAFSLKKICVQCLASVSATMRFSFFCHFTQRRYVFVGDVSEQPIDLIFKSQAVCPKRR